jgi:magnesium-transporting ATPase (P-type)
LLDKDTTKMQILNKFTNQIEEYEILAEFPFDSTRKRMSLIVKFEDKYIVMCKGADSILIPRCNFRSESQ